MSPRKYVVMLVAFVVVVIMSQHSGNVCKYFIIFCRVIEKCVNIGVICINNRCLNKTSLF